MIQQRLATSLIIAIVAALLSMPSPAAAATSPPSAEPALTFVGGGWGHGVGMSQYGALARAEAGFSAEDIIGFYYQGTQILGSADLVLDPAVVLDDVDVRVGTANCSTFVPQGPSPITIAIDGVDIGTTSSPVAISRDGKSPGPYRWKVLAGPGARCTGDSHIASIAADAGAADFCPNDLCVSDWPAPALLTITFNDGEPIAISAADKPTSQPDRSYAHGQIQLLPDNRIAPGKTSPSTRCGNPGDDDFCIVVGNMTMQQYLYGLAEVPASWPIEALRAQAIAGRSYALSRIAARDTNPAWYEPFNLYASTDDQYYVGWSREAETCATCHWLKAVDLTNDMYVATPDGQVATTFYSSSNGGYTNANEDFYQWAAWKRNPISYLRANRDPYDNYPSNPNATWERTYTLADISRWLTNYPYANLDVGTVKRISITETPLSGYIDYALVTVYGTDRTLEIRRDPTDPHSEPFGYRFWNALRIGCNGDPGCSSLPGHRVRIITFFDVDPLAYWSKPIKWMALSDISSGVAPNEFGPARANNRATLATFLWRFAGSPTPLTTKSFDDVVPGSYYETAVQWMADRGITKGTTADTFSPETVVTRAQAAAFLWRFAGKPAPAADNTTTAFEDVAPDAYYEAAVQWMVTWGITKGTTDKTFSPNAPLTRGAIATFLYRLAGKPGAFADGAFMPVAMRVP